MSAQSGECEQYIFAGRGRADGAKRSEPVLIYESPLEESGTLFMVESASGEERASFVSTARGGEAMQDMRTHLSGFRLTRVAKKHTSGRAGDRLSLA